jgi:hypothetical protein
MESSVKIVKVTLANGTPIYFKQDQQKLVRHWES